MSWWQLVGVSLVCALVLVALFAAVIVGGLLVARDALVDDHPPAIRERYGARSARGLPGTEGMAEYRDYGFHWRVLVPRPVPWPLLTVLGYGAVVGSVSALVEAVF
ncbi:hypothetical protein [Streptomyces asiaticus]